MISWPMSGLASQVPDEEPIDWMCCPEYFAFDYYDTLEDMIADHLRELV